MMPVHGKAEVGEALRAGLLWVEVGVAGPSVPGTSVCYQCCQNRQIFSFQDQLPISHTLQVFGVEELFWNQSTLLGQEEVSSPAPVHCSVASVVRSLPFFWDPLWEPSGASAAGSSYGRSYV